MGKSSGTIFLDMGLFAGEPCVVMLDLLLWLRRCFFPVMRRVGPGVCDLLCRLSASVTRISGIVIIGIGLAVVAVVVSSVMSRRLQGSSTVLQRVSSSYVVYMVHALSSDSAKASSTRGCSSRNSYVR